VYCSDDIIAGVRLLNAFLALSKGLNYLDFILAYFPFLRKESKVKKSNGKAVPVRGRGGP
jgi:hypothetical protein